MPGIMALTLVLTALQNTALPLVIEFSFTNEIEDRLLAPLHTAGVALQKMAIAALRGIVAALLILPMSELILPGGVTVSDPHWVGPRRRADRRVARRRRAWAWCWGRPCRPTASAWPSRSC